MLGYYVKLQQSSKKNMARTDKRVEGDIEK